MTMRRHEDERRRLELPRSWRSVERPIACWQPFARRRGIHKMSLKRRIAMLQGLVTDQKQMTMYRDRGAQGFLHLLDETSDVEHFPAVKTLRIRLLGDFELLANDLPISSLDVP